ncbi:oxidoreductase [Bdellovibrio bacteriovorus]|uniref:Oxidoreductase n=1 Tax=Bdellovibrio bacteriovorus TaxID=959 RepID=A0A150WK42_BDEBC|nr:SDR family NAD(P)-dependent oxidoreductase [Bdellovibrio bacteriovorus]KYG63901.1 oxidoreductase [Bdellovibrio bacteriovorus]
MEKEVSDKIKPLAVVTGASSGIGYELAKVFAKNGFDLLVIAEDPGIVDAGNAFRALGVNVETLQADLSMYSEVQKACDKIDSLGASVEAIAMNAGFGTCGDFVDTDLDTELRMIGVNNASLVHMTKRVLPRLIKQGHGRILYTSSVAATMPGPYYAVYAATKAFVQSFSEAIRAEVKDKGITVTALQPGPTDTNFFERAHMMDTKAGQGKKDDPAQVAEEGFAALMSGKDHVIAGSFMNTVQAKMANFMTAPQGAAAQGAQTKPQHR